MRPRLRRSPPEGARGRSGWRGQPLLGVFDLRGRSEILPDQSAPLRKILRAAEIDGVVFKGFPLHQETVALRLFDRAMQLKSVKTRRTAEGGAGLGDRGFKILFGAGLDLDLCDFGDHWLRPLAANERL